MNTFKTVLAASTALASASSAMAAVPVISGTYIVTYVESCQATFSYSKVGSNVTSLNTVNNGKLTDEMARMTFVAATHKFAGNGVEEQGDLLIIQNIPGGKVMKQSPWLPSGNYSNTATTVTLSGTTFRALYGNINVTTNIAYLVEFQGMPSANCTAQGRAVRQ